MARNIAQVLRDLSDRKADQQFCDSVASGIATSISYSELYRRSCAYARYYRSLGIRPGDIVLVILRHSPHQFYSYLGAILAGAIPSFMPFPSAKQRPELYWADHAALFSRIEPQLIVTYRENAEAARQSAAASSIAICVAEDSILDQFSGGDTDFAGFDAQPDDVACLQHSSGTTGLKKGVMLTHRMLFDHHAAYTQAIGFTGADSIVSWLPLYHDMGFIACFMGSFLSGTHLVALDPFEWVMRPRILLDAIEKFRTTFCWLPNFAFSHMVNAVRGKATWDLSSMRAYINCSEPCKPTTFDRFVERFCDSGVAADTLAVSYAMAENVFAVTQTPIGKKATVRDADVETGSIERRQLSCGFAVPGVKLRIMDSNTRLQLLHGEVGEIHVSSPFLFHGYYRLPEKSRERLVDGWYATGDLGYLRGEQLYVTGRLDDMLIINGRNYYAHEIEALMADIPEIVPGRSVAIGIEDERSYATVMVILAECRKHGVDAGLEAKRSVLERTGLALHAFVPVEHGMLVKTTSGKLSRTKNKELYLRGEFEPRKLSGK